MDYELIIIWLVLGNIFLTFMVGCEATEAKRNIFKVKKNLKKENGRSI